MHVSEFLSPFPVLSCLAKLVLALALRLLFSISLTLPSLPPLFFSSYFLICSLIPISSAHVMLRGHYKKQYNVSEMKDLYVCILGLSIHSTGLLARASKLSRRPRATSRARRCRWLRRAGERPNPQRRWAREGASVSLTVRGRAQERGKRDMDVR